MKGYKIMQKGSNCDRKSQLSEILTEPLNPHDGTILILAQVLQKPFLWLLCRHLHTSELTIKAGYQAVTGEKTVGPSRKMFIDIQNDWTEKYQPVLSAPGATAHFKKIDESALQVGSELHRIYLEFKSFISYALEHEVIPRGTTNI